MKITTQSSGIACASAKPLENELEKNTPNPRDLKKNLTVLKKMTSDR